MDDQFGVPQQPDLLQSRAWAYWTEVAGKSRRHLHLVPSGSASPAHTALTAASTARWQRQEEMKCKAVTQSLSIFLKRLHGPKILSWITASSSL